MMRIVHIVAGLAPGGGIAESVSLLCQHLRQLGHEVVIATLDGPMSEATLAAEAVGVRLVRFHTTGPRGLYFSWQMLRRLREECVNADVVHVHSNWTFPVWWGCYCALRESKKLVMSPRGCLDPVRMRHSAWKKRLVGWLDRHCLRRATLVHATSVMEREWTQMFSGKPDLPLLVLSDGIDTERFVPPRREIQPTLNACADCPRTVLYLGRLHPLKGLDLLLEAWARAGVRGEGKKAGTTEEGGRGAWRLVIVGPDEQGTLQSLRNQAKLLGITESVTFSGPLYGDERLKAMQSADLFVLPSRSENFGIVVAEALACGVPVITTQGAPWAELLGNLGSSKIEEKHLNNFSTLALSRVKTSRCGWWVEVGVAPLAEALQEAMGLSDEERRTMGANGRRLVESKYRWERIATEMVAAYERL